MSKMPQGQPYYHLHPTTNIPPIIYTLIILSSLHLLHLIISLLPDLFALIS
jgi:hypothetical protein